MRSVAPSNPAIAGSAPASPDRKAGIWSIERSSRGVPNRAIAVFARVAGSSIPKSPCAVLCSAFCAPSPPAATALDISCASRPIALYAFDEASLMSDPRIVNSLSESPVLSSANLPCSAALTRRLKDSSPVNPSERKLVPYSWMISGSSSRIAAGTR
ncbi:hypothetical protein CH278_02140 [Rhodococcus sp. 05-2254-5]|nr:hypothetical protein CH278_02140 [Rhodococcus sp. 05-2254-5]OZE59364.1 hypothetical protein CH269_08635 [Rhodococcus sp. 05-2254-1]